MLKITQYFWQMCLLQRGPESLPSSNFVTGLVFIVYVLIALIVVSFTRPSQGIDTIIGTISIGIGLQALVTFMLLQFKGLVQRFRATFAALLGTNAILLVLLPFNYILLTSSSDSLKLFADSATWVCLGWWLAIAGHIYHRSVEVSILQGSAIAFLVELLGVVIAFTIFPTT